MNIYLFCVVYHNEHNNYSFTLGHRGTRSRTNLIAQLVADFTVFSAEPPAQHHSSEIIEPVD